MKHNPSQPTGVTATDSPVGAATWRFGTTNSVWTSFTFQSVWKSVSPGQLEVSWLGYMAEFTCILCTNTYSSSDLVHLLVCPACLRWWGDIPRGHYGCLPRWVLHFLLVGMRGVIRLAAAKLRPHYWSCELGAWSNEGSTAQQCL